MFGNWTRARLEAPSCNWFSHCSQPHLVPGFPSIGKSCHTLTSSRFFQDRPAAVQLMSSSYIENIWNSSNHHFGCKKTPCSSIFKMKYDEINHISSYLQPFFPFLYVLCLFVVHLHHHQHHGIALFFVLFCAFRIQWIQLQGRSSSKRKGLTATEIGW